MSSSEKNLTLTPISAIHRLLEGNDRFVRGLRSVESFLSAIRLKEYAENGQKPFAVILTCSDSRIPVEIVFDQGVGSLFVIRVAGNIITPSLIASVEFAAMNLGTTLCVVMGHTECGAVKAAIQRETSGEPLPSKHIDQLVRKIRPAVLAAQREEGPDSGHLQDSVTEHNVQHSVDALIRKSPALKDLIDRKKFMIVGSVYDLHSGRVRLNLLDQPNVIPPHVLQNYAAEEAKASIGALFGAFQFKRQRRGEG